MRRKGERSERDQALGGPETVAHGRPAHFALVCGVALAICMAIKLPALLYPPSEADEQIYWQLAANLANNGEYSLRGSPLLESLSRDIYDRPVFHHPPLFAASLAPFVLADAQNKAVAVSWLGHLLAVIAVAMLGRHILHQQNRPVDYLAARFWLPLLGVATDPLLLFVSRRLWIDSLLAGLVAAAVAALVLAAGRRRRTILAVAGALLGLAGLAKLTALILGPVFLVVAVRDDRAWLERGLSAAAVTIPVGLLIVPWLLFFHSQTGVFVPSWVKPDARLMELYPFLRTAVERPWHYYLTTLAFVQPIAVLLAVALLRDRAVWRSRVLQAAAAWLVMLVGVQTLLAADGYGFQMRHIAPAVPAVYVIALCLLVERERPVLQFLCAAAILIGAVTGAFHLMVPEFDEMMTLGMIAGLLFS